jgi:hypothetical protein
MLRSLVRLLAIVVLTCAVADPATASSHSSSGSHSSHSTSSKSKSKSGSKSGTARTTHHKSSSATRDSHGRIARSEAAKHEFEVQTGYPHGRSGYVIDHIKPLACGGADAPSNMQWQTVQAAKLKDKTERTGCR